MAAACWLPAQRRSLRRHAHSQASKASANIIGKGGQPLPRQSGNSLASREQGYDRHAGPHRLTRRKQNGRRGTREMGSLPKQARGRNSQAPARTMKCWEAATVIESSGAALTFASTAWHDAASMILKFHALSKRND
ncbi:unnamed protein product, partial [Phaeothamnion confervicola]